MKLLGTHSSPYVRKVRIAFEEKHIQYDYVIAPPADPNSGVSKYNPLGKIPVLICDDGKCIYDSSVIVEYLDALGSPPKLIPDSFVDYIQVKRWQALGDGIVDSAILISRNQRQPPAMRQSADWHLKSAKKDRRRIGNDGKGIGFSNILLREYLHPCRHRVWHGARIS